MLYKSGFQELDEGTILFPTHSVKDSHIDKNISIEFDYKNISPYIIPKFSTIYNDHKDFNLLFGILKTCESSCFIVFRKKTDKNMSYADIIYLENPDVFLEQLNNVLICLFQEFKVSGLLVSSRYVNKSHHYNFKYLKQKQFFKSNILQAGDIDSLYSEIPILNPPFF